MTERKPCKHPNAKGITGDFGDSWESTALIILEPEWNPEVSQWCPDCGALAVWDEAGNRRRWIKPKGTKR